MVSNILTETKPGEWERVVENNFSPRRIWVSSYIATHSHTDCHYIFVYRYSRNLLQSSFEFCTLFKLILSEAYDSLLSREYKRMHTPPSWPVILCLQITPHLLISLPIMLKCQWVKWCNLLIPLLTSDTTLAVIKQKSLSAKPHSTARTWEPSS